MTAASRPQASEWDREYMRRLGRYKEEANAEALAIHMARSGRERIEHAIRKSAEFGTPEQFAVALEQNDAGELYARARQLGIIRS